MHYNDPSNGKADPPAIRSILTEEVQYNVIQKHFGLYRMLYALHTDNIQAYQTTNKGPSATAVGPLFVLIIQFEKILRLFLLLVFLQQIKSKLHRTADQMPK